MKTRAALGLDVDVFQVDAFSGRSIARVGLMIPHYVY